MESSFCLYDGPGQVRYLFIFFRKGKGCNVGEGRGEGVAMWEDDGKGLQCGRGWGSGWNVGGEGKGLECGREKVGMREGKGIELEYVTPILHLLRSGRIV